MKMRNICKSSFLTAWIILTAEMTPLGRKIISSATAESTIDNSTEPSVNATSDDDLVKICTDLQHVYEEDACSCIMDQCLQMLFDRLQGPPNCATYSTVPTTPPYDWEQLFKSSSVVDSTFPIIMNTSLGESNTTLETTPATAFGSEPATANNYSTVKTGPTTTAASSALMLKDDVALGVMVTGQNGNWQGLLCCCNNSYYKGEKLGLKLEIKGQQRWESDFSETRSPKARLFDARTKAELYLLMRRLLSENDLLDMKVEGYSPGPSNHIMVSASIHVRQSNFENDVILLPKLRTLLLNYSKLGSDQGVFGVVPKGYEKNEFVWDTANVTRLVPEDLYSNKTGLGPANPDTGWSAERIVLLTIALMGASVVLGTVVWLCLSRSVSIFLK